MFETWINWLTIFLKSMNNMIDHQYFTMWNIQAISTGLVQCILYISKMLLEGWVPPGGSVVPGLVYFF